MLVIFSMYFVLIVRTEELFDIEKSRNFAEAYKELDYCPIRFGVKP